MQNDAYEILSVLSDVAYMMVGGAGDWKLWYEALLILNVMPHIATHLQLGIFWERLVTHDSIHWSAKVFLSASKFAKAYR